MQRDGRGLVLGGCGEVWLLGNPWKEFTEARAVVPPARKPRGIMPNRKGFAGGVGDSWEGSVIRGRGR